MKFNLTFPAMVLALMVFLAGAAARAQTSTATSANDNKAEQIVARGVEDVGGSGYLNVHTVIGRGLFTPYIDGAPGVPSKFIDYVAYPDKERTEFTASGIRTIQTNSAGRGWIYDGSVKNIKDQNAAQLDDFKVVVRASIENLLRGWWRKENATLSYVGRREAGLGRRNETVRVTYPDGFWVEYEFGASDGLPAKVIYQQKHKNADTDAIEDLKEEDRLLKPIVIDGITTPFVVDHFRNGVQTSRINYESVEFNRLLADSLFDKPTSIKNLK